MAAQKPFTASGRENQPAGDYRSPTLVSRAQCHHERGVTVMAAPSGLSTTDCTIIMTIHTISIGFKSKWVSMKLRHVPTVPSPRP